MASARTTTFRTHSGFAAITLLGAIGFVLAILLQLVIGSVVSAQVERPTVALVTIDGTITPVMATYVGRAIDRAADRGDSAVLIEMDTPGGLSSAMDDIVSDIFASPIPVIVYVAPEGARAASAGVYITYASHVAAMAPATNIGSATPIQIGAEGSSGDDLTTAERKAINDAVADLRSIADRRERNVEWAEDAVRDAANITAREAAELDVIDFVAESRDEVLAMADGREVLVASERVEIQTEGARVEPIEMSFFEEVLQIVTDPNIAYLLLSLGSLALVFEIANPGGIGPGAIGGIMLVTGFYALGTITSNWAGLALIVLAFILFAIDVYVASGGILAVSGIAAFLIGSLLLANTRDAAVLSLSRWLIFTMTALVSVFFVFIARTAWQSRNIPVTPGMTSMVGEVGVARTALDPDGMVFLHGELWHAIAPGKPIGKGERVRVIAMDGLTLSVAPAIADSGVPPPGSVIGPSTSI